MYLFISFILFIFILFMYFIMLGLHCCMWVWWVGVLFLAVCGLGLSLLRSLLLQSTGLWGLQWFCHVGSTERTASVAVMHGLSDFAACGVLLARGQTCVPCIDRQTPIHCATKEVLGYFIIAISETLSEIMFLLLGSSLDYRFHFPVYMSPKQKLLITMAATSLPWWLRR